MSNTNGTLTPPIPQHSTEPTSGAKRKRSESSAQPQSSNQSTSNAATSSGTTTRDQQTFRDMLEVLKRHDTTPSILEHTLGTKADASNSDEPTAKRLKLVDGEAGDTIALRVRSGAYATLSDLERDISAACSEVIAPIKAKERTKNGLLHGRLPPDDVKALRRVAAFEHIAKGIIKREAQDAMQEGASTAGTESSVKNEHMFNGIKREPGISPAPTLGPNSRTVLTLFGNAPGPRQLFSSLQHAAPVNGEDTVNAETMLSLKRNVTLHLATYSHLPQTYHNSNRQERTGILSHAAAASLVSGEVLPKPSRKNGYTVQSLTVGGWLSYGGIDAVKEPTSPASKRKQRDRALSSGESGKPAPEELTQESEAKEEALFRAAYSSFAPSHDNTKALVPTEVKSQVWWHKVGRKRYDEHFAIDPALEEPSAKSIIQEEEVADGVDEAEQFKNTIDNFDEDTVKIDHVLSVARDEERDTEQVLREVSELLQTLSSYQRIRNMFLASGSRTPASPSPLLSAMVGTPTEPTVEEINTYRSLRSRLAELVDKLPPYVVAKLDGEQLEDLRVSKMILMEGKEYHGTMEEDTLTRTQRGTAMAAAAGLIRPTANANSYTPAANSYGRTPSVSTASRPAPAAATYASTRTPAPGYGQRYAGGQSQGYGNYGTPNAPATAPRPSYTQMAAYNQANRPPAQQQSYGQANGQQYGARPAYGQQYGQSTPQTQPQMRSGYPATNPSMYQNRAQNSSAYTQGGAAGSPYARSASPSTAARPATYNGPTYTQPRPAHGTTPANPSQPGQPVRNGQYYNGQQPGSGRATPNNYPAQGQTTSSVGPSGFHSSSMTADQQHVMMERQRAQLAQQPQARLAAQASQADMGRQGSGTPQPSAAAQDGRANGAPMVA
ncbi:hypothetical protein H2203_005553 [Taxawa tesnikishii (nom. ined.)]|nr:hypothetical protein H2203_005553 [Dothideales sp. JES 119]